MIRNHKNIIMYLSELFFQMMKWAWVQYSAILIVFIIFFREVKQFVFSKQVLPSIVSISK